MLFAQSPGKSGTEEPPSTLSFLRRLSYDFEIQPVDALFIPFTEKRQRAFDIVARTVVVHEG